MMGFRFPAFGWRASSWAFLVGWVSQLCAFLQEGRQNSFNFSLSSDHVEVNILLICKCLVHFPFSSGFIRLLDFLILFGYYWSCVFSLVGIPFPFLSSSLLCKRCVYVFDFWHLKLSIAGSVGIFLAGWVTYIFRVCVSAVWGVGPVQVNLGISLEGVAGLYRFSGSVVAGTVRLKWWRGGPFFLLSSVCCQFSWWLDVCGKNFCVIYSDFLW